MKKVIIMGAGPAGLAAGLKLSEDPEFEVIIYETENQVGGLSRTLDYKGNKIDIGPHRFFSKSDSITNFWKDIDKNLLTKDRLTRIYFANKFFDYPINLSCKTIFNLGLIKTAKIGISYLKSFLFPIKNEKNLEDFFINRFGKELYQLFFKDYTEKVWGIPCNQIEPEWGVQRIKEISVSKTILHALKKSIYPFKKSNKNDKTSLVDYFYYPEDGAGEMFKKIASKLKSQGGKIFTEKKIISIKRNNEKIEEVTIQDLNTDKITTEKADYFISSIPVKDLINGIENIPDSISEIANNLIYRDLIVLGLQFNKFKNRFLYDNWIYLQDKNIQAGRMEIYNNFSLKMLENNDDIWIGLEYFCNENDAMWTKTNEELIDMGIQELAKIGIFDAKDFIDGTSYKIKKAYPAYFGSYNSFGKIRKFVDSLENLFLIGRNGMHRYNNMDHSIMCGFTAAENILKGMTEKQNIWSINLEDEYQETRNS